MERNGFAMAIIGVNESIRASCKRSSIKGREMSSRGLQLNIRQKKMYEVAVAVTKRRERTGGLAGGCGERSDLVGLVGASCTASRKCT